MTNHNVFSMEMGRNLDKAMEKNHVSSSWLQINTLSDNVAISQNLSDVPDRVMFCCEPQTCNPSIWRQNCHLRKLIPERLVNQAQTLQFLFNID